MQIFVPCSMNTTIYVSACLAFSGKHSKKRPTILYAGPKSHVYLILKKNTCKYSIINLFSNMDLKAQRINWLCPGSLWARESCLVSTDIWVETIRGCQIVQTLSLSFRMFKFEQQHPSLDFRLGTSKECDYTQSALLFFFSGKFCRRH